VFYPCESADGPFPATTLTGGFTNTKEQMYWLAEHLVTHGYIIIAITPDNTLGTAPTWEKAHKAGINKLKSENGRSTSPIYGLVDTAKLQISGYSMGGGGTLLAAHDLGSQIASAQAFAPFGGGTTLSGIQAATICYAGGADTVASPSSVISSYNSLPNAIERTYAEFTGVSHLDWISGSSTTRAMFKTYITAWMKVRLDGDASYSEYIDGHQSWFDEFAINVDVAGGGCN
jgi:predicted dienelactone hydrolase